MTCNGKLLVWLDVDIHMVSSHIPISYFCFTLLAFLAKAGAS